MDSPETDKITTTTTATAPSSDSIAIQYSPIFSYINNLSPIKPVKAAPVQAGFHTMLERAEAHLQEKSSFDDIKTVDTDGKQGSGEMPSCVCPEVESNLSTGYAYEGQHCEHTVAQLAGGGCKDELDCTSQCQPESLQIIQEYEDCGEITRAASNELVENVMLLDPKASQHHRVTHRRCLQFEDAQQNIMGNNPGSWNPSNSLTSSKSPASPTDSEVLESSCVEISAISSSRQMVNLTQPVVSVISPLKSSIFTISKPPGIGLHLNSIVYRTPIGCGATVSMKSAEKGYLSIQGKTKCLNGSILSNVIERVSASTEDGNHETQASVTANSSISQSPHIVEPFNNPALLRPTECQATPYDRMKFNSEHSDTVKELNQWSPKKRRKKASGTSDGDSDGCKHCNCKKTKCLKLYCDCFAAGIYCAEPCACQECFNRPKYEDTVLETRQQIESRNPLAFAPKIVQRVTESPANSSRGDANRLTPSLTKHKRGCNCKKSMCLKKYCECYQANVGCSDGCRCEGCKNVYGRKEEYGMTKDVVNKQSTDERLEDAFDEKLEMVATRNSFFQTELCNPHNLTPLTPSFQCSDRRKDASKSQFPSRRYILSPESDLASLQPYGKSPGSTRNSNHHDLLLKTRKDILDVVSCHQELDYDNAETVDEFSPRRDGLANIHHLTTLPDPPSIAMASSTSSETRDWTNVSRGLLCPGSGHFSSVNSLRWRSSPITPMTQFGGAKLLRVLDSDDKLYDILEDDIPEILKDPSTPLNPVKVSSPNKKRVSPPHSHLHELGSSSSAGLRSGRRYILQAVPAFPPLTPCIDSREATNENMKDPQNCSSNK